jgi:hypothetical protein
MNAFKDFYHHTIIFLQIKNEEEEKNDRYRFSIVLMIMIHIM